MTQQERQLRTALNDQTLQYVRSLERRLLEHELANRNNNVENSANLAASNVNKSTTTQNGNPANGKITDGSASSFRTIDVFSGRPEAVVRAMQILEVREQLDRDRNANLNGNISTSPEHMDEGEKALLREMCNVVWRKLEDGSNNQDTV